MSFSLKFFTPSYFFSTMCEPPDYNNAQENFLNPNLVFSAMTYRLYYEERDRAFAKAIVDFIANEVRYRLIFEACRGWTYGFSENKTELVWDTEMGYPAIEAFKTNRVPFIVEEAKLDLRKRGFIVEQLKLYLSDGTKFKKGVKVLCTKTAVECKCGYHGIFVKWKLGRGG